MKPGRFPVSFSTEPVKFRCINPLGPCRTFLRLDSVLKEVLAERQLAAEDESCRCALPPCPPAPLSTGWGFSTCRCSGILRSRKSLTTSYANLCSVTCTWANPTICLDYIQICLFSKDRRRLKLCFL